MNQNNNGPMRVSRDKMRKQKQQKQIVVIILIVVILLLLGGVALIVRRLIKSIEDDTTQKPNDTLSVPTDVVTDGTDTEPLGTVTEVLPDVPDTDTQTTEPAATETEPETVPAETETEPVKEPETEPVETEPAETEPAETEPAETEPAAEPEVDKDGKTGSGQFVSTESKYIKLLCDYSYNTMTDGSVSVSIELKVSVYEAYLKEKKDMCSVTVGGETRTFTTPAITHETNDRAEFTLVTDSFIIPAGQTSVPVSVAWDILGTYHNEYIETLHIADTISLQ